MRDRGQPLFLARRSYRRRRLIDAMRLLPLFGGVVILIPLLWSQSSGGSLALRGLFLFGVWGVLVVVSAYLSHLLATHSDEPSTAPPQETEVPSDGG
ncbi:MAG: hypothetical protein OIF40_00740 [Mangrovicoccus sp.]|nr:hypothetical protein [Mangrovicoccus sp.]